MRTVTKTIEVFKFHELDGNAVLKARTDVLRFFLDLDYDTLTPCFQKAIDKAEKMKTPWFAHEYINECEECREIMQAMLEDYEYLKTGEVYHE
jgi:hypothetical protein